MSNESPVRPARRATRRPAVVDESEDELSLIHEDNDEEFTPAPKRSSPRKSTRRQTTANINASPKKSARARKVKTGDAIEPSEIFDPEESIAPSESASPTKKASPRKRQSTAPRKDRQSSVSLSDLTQTVEADDGLTSLPPSPTKSASPRKRMSSVPRKGRRSSAVPPVPSLPTPAIMHLR